MTADEEAGAAAQPPERSADVLDRENRILQRRLHRLEANVQRMEHFQDSNATLLTRLLSDLDAEKARSQALLRNVLPQRVIDRLEAGEQRIADRHDDVAVLFGDFVGFTRIASELPPADLVAELDELFRGFDAICDRLEIEKIKTVGDAYLAVAGLAGSERDPAMAIADAALEMIELVRRHPHGRAAWELRIGLHAGPIVAGVVGSSKFAYDVWGDTINVASRLQTTSDPGRIHVSPEVARRLEGSFTLEPRGAIALKGKGDAQTCFLLGRRADP
jgi:class 3 adenylate cyclase